MAVCLARRSLVGTALLLALVAGADGATYVALLAASGAAAAAGASCQVRHDDALGWLGAAAVAGPVAILTIAAHSSGLPAHRPAEWSTTGIALLVLAVVTMVAGLVAFVLPPAPPDVAPEGALRS